MERIQAAAGILHFHDREGYCLSLHMLQDFPIHYLSIQYITHIIGMQGNQAEAHPFLVEQLGIYPSGTMEQNTTKKYLRKC